MSQNGFGMFLIGLFLGALSGAVAALLLAPQSGAETRGMIKDKSIELRDKAQQTAEQARAKAGEITQQVKERGQSAVKAVRGDGAREEMVEPAA